MRAVHRPGERTRIQLDLEPDQVQLLDLSGKLVRSEEVSLNSKSQIENFNLPDVAKGSYLLKVVSESNKVSVTNKLVVQ